MSRVEIEAGGRRIVVDHDTELEHVTRAARELWDHTAGNDERLGPAYGFSAQARWTPDTSATNGDPYRNRPFAPVTAESEDSSHVS